MVYTFNVFEYIFNRLIIHVYLIFEYLLNSFKSTMEVVILKPVQKLKAHFISFHSVHNNTLRDFTLIDFILSVSCTIYV